MIELMAAVVYLITGCVIAGMCAKTLQGQPVTALCVILFWPFIAAMTVGVMITASKDTTTHSAKEE